MDKLPIDGRSQEIGRLAGRALGNKLPRSWIEKELDGDADFGIDYFIQLKSSDGFVAFSFYLQLKGTTAPSYSADHKYISYDFKVSTLKYYHQQEPLVMVAIVDIEGNEDKLWECPIFYVWLDEDWFSDNENKLANQKTISVKVPTTQLLEQSLDVYDFYAKRVEEKFAVAELKKEIKPHTEDLVQSIDALAKVISEKPIFLKAVEHSGDEPWIENPKGEVASLLKQCCDSLNCNQLTRASEILVQLESTKSSFGSHDLAEYYFQEAALLSAQGNYLQAKKKLKYSIELSDKDRYKLGYIESSFKLTVLPNDAELNKIAQSLPVHDYRNAIVKAKCLALTGNADEAFNLLKNNFPNKIVGQLMILTINNNTDEIDEIVESFDGSYLESDRDKYIYYALVARRAYVKANFGSVVYGEVLPFQGKVNVSLEWMQEAYEKIVKAWDYARRLGYPSDVTVLFDISPFIFSYFNSIEDLYYHFEQLLEERPSHSVLIKQYSRLLFNGSQYEKTISLLNRIKSDLDVDDYGMLILSNYYLKRPRVALDLLKEKESYFIESNPDNLDFIFCIGSEIAHELLDEELAEKYLKIVKGFDSGEALICIRSFVRASNADPDNRAMYASYLYSDYIKLGKPVVIAEQLFGYLDPKEPEPASQVIELANNITLIHDLYEREYFRLAQALITTGGFKKALDISVKHMNRKYFDPYWHIIKVVCLQKMGRIGLAYDEIKESLGNNRFSNDHLKQYVSICLQFGLMHEIEEILIDLFNNTEQREERLSFLSNLISIYSSEQGFSEKLKKSIRRFGQLVNINNSTEEGQFLIYFLMSPENDNQKEVEEFQHRLSNYTAKFPDSKILKQGAIDLDSGSDALLSSIHKITGVTDDQLNKWEKNRKKIRNGVLPVPFSMLERFLPGTSDLFNTWVLANNTTDDQLEFKLNQAPQLEQAEFDSFLLERRSLIIEDSSLLILNETSMLSKLLDEVDEFCILGSTFEKISINNHPIVGSIYSYIPKSILNVVNEYKEKLRIIYEDSTTPFDVIKKESKSGKGILLTDDSSLLRLVSTKEGSPISANSYNVVEYLFNKSIISKEEKYSLVSKICSFGIHQPNMSIKLLADSLAYFTDMDHSVDYSETGFKKIFDKVFSVQRNMSDVVKLFFEMLFFASENTSFSLKSSTLLPLFRGVLIRHQYEDLDSFTAFWFVYQCMVTKVSIDFELIPKSTRHVELWNVYKEIMFEINNKEITTHDLLLKAVTQLFLLDQKPRVLAYQNIKSCFTPLTEESEIFYKIYNELIVSRKLRYWND